MSSNIGGILPKGKTQFLDATGTPLAGGTVAFYIPGTTTQIATYQDQALSIANANPVILDANGEALIWGFGSYRQIVQDSSGNTLWDAVISAPAVPVFGIDSGAANAMVVTINGIASLYTGMQLIVIPANANTVGTTLALNGLTPVSVTTGTAAIPAGALVPGVAAQMVFDGTNFQLLNSQVPPSTNAPGDIKAIAGSTAPAGWDLCFGKTYSRSLNATLFAAIGTLWGAGDGATTFVGPDFRGRSLFGADGMGGTAANNLTSASLGGTATAIVGVVGGSEDVQEHQHAVTVTDPTHSHWSATTGDIDMLADLGAGTGNFNGVSGTDYVGVNLAKAATGITVAEANYGTGESQNLPPAAVINWVMCVG